MDTDRKSAADPDARPLLYLEDLHVGAHFVTGTHLIDAAQIRAFAAQFDPQPFHLSEDGGRSSVFGGLVASGWHTAAVTMRLLVEGGPRLAGGMVGASAEAGWPQPTRPGDMLQVQSEIVAVKPSRSRPDRGIATVRSETRNQRGELLQTVTAHLIVPRRAPSSESPA